MTGARGHSPAAVVVPVLFVVAITLALAAMKTFGALDWSWWWITSPLWISSALAAVGFLAVLVVIAEQEARGE